MADEIFVPPKIASLTTRRALCACGCGGIPRKGRTYIWKHSARKAASMRKPRKGVVPKSHRVAMALFGEEALKRRGNISIKQLILEWAAEKKIIDKDKFSEVLGWIDEKKDAFMYVQLLRTFLSLLPTEHNVNVNKNVVVVFGFGDVVESEDGEKWQETPRPEPDQAIPVEANETAQETVQ